MIYNLKNKSIEGYNNSENYSFPKYTSQLINWANQNAWLVDDRKKSLEPFAKAGGNTIEFTGDWEKTVAYLSDMMKGVKTTMTLDEAKEYIKSVRWQYAKTYVTAPHEYTVLDWKPETKEQMIDFANFILANGYKEQFYSKTFTVLQIDEYKYWSMDFPTENTDLINRTFIDDERKAKIVKFVQTPDFKHVYKMSLRDVEEQMLQNADCGDSTTEE